MSSPSYEGAIITNNNSQPLQLTTITSYNNNNNNNNHENNHNNNNGNGIIMEQQQRGPLTEHQLQIETQDRPPAIRKFHYFKNPPQPHMCIKDVTFDGQEIFINVMSWIRIAMPDQSSDPIPLYGGMRVHSSNLRSPQFIYAVMANPTILKDIKRNCSDVQDKLALIELMCDFVEAMNPGLKLIRQPEVLKDRDLAGELKDVWSAVQVKREREKESAYRSNNHERMSFEGGTVMYEHQQQYQKQQQYYQIRQEQDQQNHIQYKESANHQYIDGNGCINEKIVDQRDSNNIMNGTNPNELVVDYNTIMNARNYHNTTHDINIKNNVDAICNETTTLSISNGEAEKNLPYKSSDLINNGENLIVNATTANLTTPTTTTTTTITTAPAIITNTIPTTPSKIPVITKPTVSIIASINNTLSSLNKTSLPPPSSLSASSTTGTVTATVSSPSLTKKEKLGSFLPNGCHNIFPFIKSKTSSSSNSSNNDGNNTNNKGSKQEKSEKSQQKDKNRSNSFKKSNKTNTNNNTTNNNNEKQLNSITPQSVVVVTSSTTITAVQTSSTSSIMVSSNSNNKIVKNIENELLNNEMKNVQVKDEQLIIDKSRSIKIGSTIGNPSTIITEK